jgi:hypothetical protein
MIRGNKQELRVSHNAGWVRFAIVTERHFGDGGACTSN